VLYDTIVIGAGLAGLMAAIGRAERGERVLLLAKGHGATHWAAGCVDMLDVPGDPLAAAADLPPAHPYRIAGADAIEQGLARLRALCEAAGYPLAGSLRRNVLLPTAAGALRPTCLLPATMAAGDSRLLADGRPTLVASFPELRDFFPPLIASNLRAQGYPADSVYLETPPGERRIEFGPMIYARLFERPEFRAEVGRQLREHVRRGGYGRVAMPAVLGTSHALAVVHDLQQASGALIFEIPTLPTSVAGTRLYAALAAAFEAAGGRIQTGSFVQRGEGERGRLTAIYSEAAAREQRHRAARYVLATGGIAGGGLRADHAGLIRETALDLPLRAPNARGDWFAPRFLDEAGHPVFRAGVAVDAQLRPLDAAGQVVYENVSVAGGAIAGYDPIREGCLEGVAVATGWMAGNL
jgi:glycerol-3-phosphate dehydrogenase subunit B